MNEKEERPDRRVWQEGSELLTPRHPPETADEAEGGSERDRSLQEERPPHHDAR